MAKLKRVLRSIFSSFHWPTLSFQIMVWGFTRSWMNAAMIPAAMMFDYLFFLGADSYISQRRKSHILGALDELGPCKLSEIPLRRVISEQAINEFYRGVYSPELGKSYIDQSGPIDRQIRIFVIDAGEEVGPPLAATAMQQLDGNCIILVADPVENMTRYQRFELLHELGHATKRNAVQLSRLAGLVLYQWFCLWALVLLGSKRLGPISLAIGLLALLRHARTSYRYSPQNLREAAFDNELAADYFAVSQSDPSDVARLESILMKVELLDPRLDSEANVRRKAVLIERVRLRAAGTTIPEPSFGDRVPRLLSLINIILLAAVAYLGQSNTPTKIICIYVLLALIALATSMHAKSVIDMQTAIHAKLDQMIGPGIAESGTSAAGARA